jgi:hypothetical protein
VPQLEYLGKEGGRKDNKDTGLKMPHLSNWIQYRAQMEWSLR